MKGEASAPLRRSLLFPGRTDTPIPGTASSGHPSSKWDSMAAQIIVCRAFSGALILSVIIKLESADRPPNPPDSALLGPRFVLRNKDIVII